MKKISLELSAAEKMRVVITHFYKENPSGYISVSALCRLAGVHRSTVYEHHPEILEELRSKKKPKEILKVSEATKEPAQEEHNIAKRNHALLYICLEMKAEVEALRARLPKKSK